MVPFATTHTMENPNIPTVKRLCHVFRALGMSDLRLHSPLGLREVVYFLHTDSHFEAPVNGFYAFENKEWMNVNLREYMRTELRVRKLKGRIERATFDVLRVMRAYVSLGNGLRTAEEMLGGKDGFAQARQAYEKAIVYSFDESAILAMERIKAKPDQVVLSSTDDVQTNLVPEAVRALVAEAFCGLSMIAMHEDHNALCIGFAMISTFKHERASLPMINGIRVVAAAKMGPVDDETDNRRTVVESLTSVVMLPAYKRSCDAEVQALYEAEMACWNEDGRKEFGVIAMRVVDRATSLCTRYGSSRAVVRSKFNVSDGCYVEKVCPVCGTGVAGETLKRCSGCCKVFYCSRECQLAAWKAGHKAVCAKKSV